MSDEYSENTKRYYDGFDGSLSLLSNNSLEKTLSLTILFVVSESNHSTKHAYKHTHTTPSIQFSEIMATGLQTRLSSADVDFDAFDAETLQNAAVVIVIEPHIINHINIRYQQHRAVSKLLRHHHH